jgi:hypothetical protein
MSKARKNFIYSQIQAALAERLSTEEIEKALSPIFDQVAIATIRSGDIYAQAQRLAMPMDEQGVLDILNALESHLSQEDSLSLDAVNDQVQAWFDKMDWERLSSERMKELQGSFLLLHFPKDAETPAYKNLPEINLWEVCREAQGLAKESNRYVEILSIDPNLGSDDLDTQIACSNSLMAVEAS